MTEEEAVHATNDALMECAGKILEIAEQTEAMVTGALLAYQVLDSEGDPQVSFVVTQDMKLTEVVGIGEYVRADALDQLLYPDRE